MELWEAIKCLQEGKKIRSVEWTDERGYVYLGDFGYAIDENGNIYSFDCADFKFKWELYEETEKSHENPSLEVRIEQLETQFIELESKIERRLRNEMSASFKHLYNERFKFSQELLQAQSIFPLHSEPQVQRPTPSCKR